MRKKAKTDLNHQRVLSQVTSIPATFRC